ncbi:MAG: hypothetical protein ACJ77Z_01780 [Thermoleophilaceae bacterium]
MDSTSTLEKDEPRELMTSSPDELATELTAPLVAAGAACPHCGARMASDQRYCIECGERRTGAGLRDALPRTQTTAAVAAPPRRPKTSVNTNLIAGIATLLIAMGVGVLIGRTGDHSSKSAGTTPVQVVTMPSAGAAGAAVGTVGGGAAAKTVKAAKKSKARKAAASSGGTARGADGKAVKLPPRVVKVGGKCTKGAKGCQGGKFTGNFFGQ